MSDHRPYIRLPVHLSEIRPATLVSEPHDDEQFAAHEVDFVRHLFGRCAYLREQSRPTPVSDAFLSVFVDLIDILDANAPAEAPQCATQLRQVIRVVFPDLPPEIELRLARSPGASAIAHGNLMRHNGHAPGGISDADQEGAV